VTIFVRKEQKTEGILSGLGISGSRIDFGRAGRVACAIFVNSFMAPAFGISNTIMFIRHLAPGEVYPLGNRAVAKIIPAPDIKPYEGIDLHCKLTYNKYS
jgi:hypothetical protein